MVPTSFLLVILTFTSSWGHVKNRIDDDPLEQARSEILSEQTLQNVGGLINNFVSSDGAKQLGDILANAAASDKAGEILQGLGSVLGQAQGIDPSIIGTVMSMMQPAEQKNSGVDMGAMVSLLGNLVGNQGGGDAGANLWNYAPMLLQTANAFLGPEAQERMKSHAGHANLLPPAMEKIHLWFDHFMNSEIGKRIINTIGGEKFVKVFADENGKLSYRKMVDMLENHSFRKHWIKMVTSRIASVLSYFSDSDMQKKYLVTVQHFVNSILRSQGFPKDTLFDKNRPVDTISAFVNYILKEYLSTNIDSRQYVKPAVNYVEELFRLAEHRGMLNMDEQHLSDKLADTINLDVIEPVVRVNRAYRFAQKVPKCDRYVMCLANQDFLGSESSMKPLLSKTVSLVMSWFLSSKTGTPYFDLYTSIMDGNCQRLYLDACHDFHIEEDKVRQEYVHNEL